MSPRFDAVARNVFDPVASRCHMTFRRSTASLVRYGNDVVDLSIRYDPTRSYELGVTLSFAPDRVSGRPEFELAEVLRVKGAPEAEKISRLQVAKPEQLPEFLRQLAELLERHAGALLNGDAEEFRRLGVFRAAESRRYALDEISSARARAEAAWKEKDYAGVVAAFAPVARRLTPAEKKKLEYAREKNER